MNIEKQKIEAMLESQKNIRKLWTDEEVSILQELLKNGITSAKVVKEFGFLKKRSIQAIRMKIESIRGKE